MKLILQKLKRQEKDEYQLAERYYMIISAVNNLKLTQREVQLVAFTAVKGNISYANIRKEFCEKHGTTNASINNIISNTRLMTIIRWLEFHNFKQPPIAIGWKVN
jgi:hypothetical protein